MKNWKNLGRRGLSLLVCLMMCLSMLPGVAYADEADVAVDEYGHVHEDGYAREDDNGTADEEKSSVDEGIPVEDAVKPEDTATPNGENVSEEGATEPEEQMVPEEAAASDASASPLTDFGISTLAVLADGTVLCPQGHATEQRTKYLLGYEYDYCPICNISRWNFDWRLPTTVRVHPHGDSADQARDPYCSGPQRLHSLDRER